MYLTFRGLNFEELFTALKVIKARYLLLLFASMIITYLLRAFRWQLILKKIKKIGFFELIKYLMAGFFLNNVLPMRAGEFYRAYMLGTNYKFSRSACLASIVVERASDGVSFLILTALAVSLFEMPKVVITGVYGMIFALICLLVMILSAVRLKAYYFKIISILPFKTALKERINNALANFIGGLDTLLSGKTLIGVMGMSVTIWFFEVFSCYILTRAFGIELAFYKITVLMTMLGLGVMVPFAPGYVGTFEFAGKTALEMLGIGSSLAVAYVVALHALQIIFIALLGLPALLSTQFKWDYLKKCKTEGV